MVKRAKHMSDMSEKHMLEEHLFKPVSDFLIKNGYQVRSELKFCDIIAIKGDELIIVELKKHRYDLFLQDEQ
jgi:hypothetical protein